ncbi:MAG: hypoxanthine phosphoribosyltransferase [Clostridiales bacterium]|nr:hypoxanthine phosphoribosyltransferase [Clostridiales bacterium]
MSFVLDDSIEIKRTVYDSNTLQEKAHELGQQITGDYKGKELVIVGVIKGALYFFSDLTRAVDLPIMIDMIGFGNIPDTTKKTGAVKITKDINIDISGKHVIIAEDVIRTGLTTAYLTSYLESKGPADIAICTMFFNPDRLLIPIPVKYYGFEIDDSWLLGYGMDRNEIGRNLPYVAELPKKEQ